jgi:hypothetical protein
LSPDGGRADSIRLNGKRKLIGYLQWKGHEAMERKIYGVFVGSRWALTRNLRQAVKAMEREVVRQGAAFGEVRGKADGAEYPSYDSPTFRVLSDRVRSIDMRQPAD